MLETLFDILHTFLNIWRYFLWGKNVQNNKNKKNILSFFWQFLQQPMLSLSLLKGENWIFSGVEIF